MRDSESPGLRLTVGQRRHLEVSFGQILGGIEEALAWFHRWPLPADRQEKAIRELQILQTRIRNVANHLGFNPSSLRPDPEQRLEALASEWWSTILDCRSEVLRGYGKVDPSTAPLLDPLVEGLASALLELGRS